LSEEQIRELYGNASALLLPMNDSGANTAVVTALAMGLPVITTDTGGIRDYGGNSVFPVVPNDADQEMIDLTLKYLADDHWRAQVGAECRSFAERNLAWPIVARQHVEFYEKVSQ